MQQTPLPLQYRCCGGLMKGATSQTSCSAGHAQKKQTLRHRRLRLHLLRLVKAVWTEIAARRRVRWWHLQLPAAQRVGAGVPAEAMRRVSLLQVPQPQEWRRLQRRQGWCQRSEERCQQLGIRSSMVAAAAVVAEVRPLQRAQGQSHQQQQQQQRLVA